MLNVNKLKAKLVENGMSVGKLAIKMEMNRSTLYRKITNEKLTVKEAGLIMHILDLKREEAEAIFFSSTVA